MARRTSGLSFATTISILLFTLHVTLAEPLHISTLDRKPSSTVINAPTKNFAPIHKALLTQRGYIQFLRWELPVPEIEEFTFCVWVKSTNLTYPHSIFSYSKDEKDRLVRAWISSQGQSVHLEINNREILSYPTFIEEHRWYHICQSWTNVNGRYGLWIDGQKAVDGYATKTSGHVIPSNGDIVLGQEYTDFDKGLEEGVEGAVLGFNLLLSSAFDSPRLFFERNKVDEVGLHGETDTIGYGERLPGQPSHESSRYYARVTPEHPVFGGIPLPGLRSRESGAIKRSRRIRRRNVSTEESRIKRKSHFSDDWENDYSFGTTSRSKPLGQQLVEISFQHCQQGRASPHIGGNLMLISWSRTPVKVFGGAILKNANNDCGNF